MLFSELWKIMVNKVTFLGFRESDRRPGSASGISGFLRMCVHGFTKNMQSFNELQEY